MEAVAGLSQIVNEETYLPTRSSKAVSDKTFEADLAAIETAFAAASQSLDEHALFVYGRTANEADIEIAYQKRKVQVATLQSSLQTHGTRLQQLEDDHVDITSNFVKTENRLRILWAKYFLLNEKCTTVVAPLLAAQVHKDALVTCKKTITACEEILRKKSSTQELHKELDKIAEELAKECANQEGRCSKLNPVLQRNIRSLHAEASSFHKYTLSLLIKRDLADVTTLLADLTVSSPQAAEALDAPLIAPVAHPEQKVDRDVSTLISKFTALSLETNLKFKPDIWFRSFRYGKIFSTVEEMEAYATALQGLRKALENRIYEICQGTSQTSEKLKEESRSYSKTIKAIQKDLQEAKAKLKEGEFSRQIHAGLDYAAEHLAISEEIMHLSDIFSHLVRKEPMEVFNALVHFHGLINLPGYSPALFKFIQQLQRITKLPAKHGLNPVVSKIREIAQASMKQTVRQRGLSFVELSSKEAEVRTSILQKRSLTQATPDDDIAATIASLVIKQCTEFLHLHKSRSDVSFSLFLHLLTTHPDYKKIHEKQFLPGSAYRELVEKYLSVNPLASSAHSFDIFGEIFALIDELETAPKSSTTVYTYTHVRYLLEFHLKGEHLSKLTHDAKTRLSSVKTISDNFIIPQDTLLYKTLLKAVWGNDQAAILQVEQMRAGITLAHEEPVIQTLLDAFLLQKLKTRPSEESPDDRKRLQLLLARYLQDLTLQQAFGKMHNYFFIEKLLKKELIDSTSPVWSIVHKVRDQTLHQTWEKVLSDYEEWLNDKGDGAALFNAVTPIVKGQSGYELFFTWIFDQVMNHKLEKGSAL
jgi:hypothetical protein